MNLQLKVRQFLLPDVNTGQVKVKPDELPEVEEPADPDDSEFEDNFDEDFEDEDEEMPSDDEIMAMEQGFEGSEE